MKGGTLYRLDRSRAGENAGPNKSTGAAAAGKALIEPIYTSACVHHFLFAGIKRMALRAHFYSDVFGESRAGFNDVATAAGGDHFCVLGLDVLFHWSASIARMPPPDLVPGTAYWLKLLALRPRIVPELGACASITA